MVELANTVVMVVAVFGCAAGVALTGLFVQRKVSARRRGRR